MTLQKKIFTYIVTLISLHFYTLSKNPHDLETWCDSYWSNILEESRVIAYKPMQDFLAENSKQATFTSKVFFVVLENGLKAVFKAYEDDDLVDAYGELYAYKASCILGFPYIPPTVLKTIDGKTGSLQLYVDTSFDLHDTHDWDYVLEHVDRDYYASLMLFYFVFGQWDVGRDNMLAVEYKNKIILVAIDNANIRYKQHVRYGEKPFVEWVSLRIPYQKIEISEFPFESAREIHYPHAHMLREFYGDMLRDTFYERIEHVTTPQSHPFFCVPYNGFLWKQYFSVMIAYTNHFPTHVIDTLKTIDYTMLTRLFADSVHDIFLSDEYIQAILERRDQVLAAWKEGSV